MIASTQPSSHNRLKSLNSFSVSLLGNMPHSLTKHQWLGSVDAALEGRKIVVFPVFSRRAGKLHVAAGPAFLRISS
jgi:hypothetical protein